MLSTIEELQQQLQNASESLSTITKENEKVFIFHICVTFFFNTWIHFEEDCNGSSKMKRAFILEPLSVFALSK